MSNEKTCEACGGPGINAMPTTDHADICGAMACSDCWSKGSQFVHASVRARRQRTAEPRFVDRNGVELHLDDVIRCDGMQDIAIVALYRREAFGRIETIADAPREPGSSAPRRAINLEKFWTRIDPPADEGRPVVKQEPWGPLPKPAPSRYTLIDRLLGEAGYLPPPSGYGDFERARVTRMVDAQAAMLARLERDLGMVAMLGEMFCRTSGDCEP